jgi:uncharacterized protein YcfJ
MKYLSLIALLIASPVVAGQTTAAVEDIYVNRVYIEPYVERTCEEVQVPIYGQTKGANGGDVLMGMIFGGLLGKGITGKDNGAAAGAVMGGVIAADKGSRQTITGYKTELQCGNYDGTREVSKRVYSHSIVTFRENGKKYSLQFTK